MKYPDALTQGLHAAGLRINSWSTHHTWSGKTETRLSGMILINATTRQEGLLAAAGVWDRALEFVENDGWKLLEAETWTRLGPHTALGVPRRWEVEWRLELTR